MKLIIYSILFLFLLSGNVGAQNLVPNPSFEQVSDCDLYFDDFDRKATHWKGYKFTPDLFNACSQSSYLGVPNNVFDRQPAHTGKGYAGILTYHWEFPNEVIGTKLTQALHKGEKYEVSFKVSRAASHALYATNNLGLLFTNQPEKSYNCQQAHLLENQVITESEVWITIAGVFLADADYQYLVIGNFFDQSRTKLQKMSGGAFDAAYYFIDDVYVAKAKPDAQVTINQTVTQNPLVKIEPKKENKSTVIEKTTTDNQTKIDEKKTATPNKPEAVIAISGKVLDADSKLPLVALVEFMVPDSPQKQDYETDFYTGQYAFANIKKTEKFTIRLSARNYYPQVVSFFPKNEARIQKDFYLYALRAGQSIEMKNVWFKSNEAEILPQSYEELNRVIEILNDNPKMRIELSGYTDRSDQIELALRRAKAIKNHLETVGKIDPRRLSFQAYKQTQAPKYAGGAADESGKIERVEFKILN
ncbi:MAG: OmpA family protein [Microscillaceae bacterium]|nr:OmpA family protein [Microscillaceae bacterium]